MTTAPATLNFTLTSAGIAALFNAANTGVQAVFATVAVGTGIANGGTGVGYTPQGTETALKNQFLSGALGSGSKPAANQLMFGVSLDGLTPGWINEIGLFLSDGTLFALWSQDPAVVQYTTSAGVAVYGAPLGYKSVGVPYALGALLTFTGIPLTALTFSITGPLVQINFMNPPPNCAQPSDPVAEAGNLAALGLTRAASDAEFAAGAPAAASNFKWPFPTLQQVAGALADVAAEIPGAATAAQAIAGAASTVWISPASLIGALNTAALGSALVTALKNVLGVLWPGGTSWQTLPGGWIIQWGTGTASANPGATGASATLSFPRAFPTACLCLLGNSTGPDNTSESGGWAVVSASGTPSTSSATFHLDVDGYVAGGGFESAVSFFWLALGN